MTEDRGVVLSRRDQASSGDLETKQRLALNKHEDNLAASSEGPSCPVPDLRLRAQVTSPQRNQSGSCNSSGPGSPSTEETTSEQKLDPHAIQRRRAE